MSKRISYKMPEQLFHADRSTDAMQHLDELVHTRLNADSTYRTHITVREGELFTAVPRQINDLLSKISSYELQIADLWGHMTRVMQRNYITQSISEEMLATNEMEGVRSTRKEMAQAIAKAEDERQQIDTNAEHHTRFSEFARLYLNLTDQKSNFPSTLEELRATYDQVTNGEIAEENLPDGQLFRTEDVEITTGTRNAHEGVQGEQRIEQLLTQMLNLARSSQWPPILRALVTHYIFEYVHPFYDGNGRTGRYLLALSLRQHLTLPTVLSLSQTIATHKERYYKAFSVSENPLNRGELTYFVLTLLGLIHISQQELISDLKTRITRMESIRRACNQYHDQFALSERATDMLLTLMQEETFDATQALSLDDLASIMQCSKQSVRNYLDELDQCGLIQFVSRKPIRVRIQEQ